MGKDLQSRERVSIQQTHCALPSDRLTFRFPIWKDSQLGDDFNLHSNWLEFVAGSSGVKNLGIITQVAERLPEMDLSRQTWSRLGRFRIGHGRYRDILFR